VKSFSLGSALFSICMDIRGPVVTLFRFGIFLRAGFIFDGISIGVRLRYFSVSFRLVRTVHVPFCMGRSRSVMLASSGMIS